MEVSGQFHRSWRFGEEKNFLHLPGFEPCIPQRNLEKKIFEQ